MSCVPFLVVQAAPDVSPVVDTGERYDFGPDYTPVDTCELNKEALRLMGPDDWIFAGSVYNTGSASETYAKAIELLNSVNALAVEMGSQVVGDPEYGMRFALSHFVEVVGDTTTDRYEIRRV